MIQSYVAYNNAQSNYAAVRALSITNQDIRLLNELTSLKLQCDEAEKTLIFNSMATGALAALLAGAVIVGISDYKSSKAEKVSTTPIE